MLSGLSPVVGGFKQVVKFGKALFHLGKKNYVVARCLPTGYLPVFPHRYIIIQKSCVREYWRHFFFTVSQKGTLRMKK